MAASSRALATLPLRSGRQLESSAPNHGAVNRGEATRKQPIGPQRTRCADDRSGVVKSYFNSGRSVARADVLSQLYFADLRLLGVILNDMPTIVALWRVAPSVRLRDFAIFESGSLRAMLFRRRRSSFDHGRRTGAFLLRIATLATIAPLHISTTGMALCMICATLQVLRRLRASVINLFGSNSDALHKIT
jgi:hypothetical protein